MNRVFVYLSGLIALIVLSVSINGVQNTLELGLNQISTTRFVVDGDILFVDGIINAKSLRQFDDVIATQPQVKALVLGEIPGSIDDDINIALGYRVRELGLGTSLLAHSDVRSGGVDLFLAGLRRTIEEGAILGVHSWTDNTTDGADLDRDDPKHALTRDYIAAMLGDDAFYWFTLAAAPSDGMYLMTGTDIDRFGLLSPP